MKKDAREVLIEILGVLNEVCQNKLECLREAEKYYSEDTENLKKLEGRYEGADYVRDKITKIIFESIKED